MGLSQCAEWIYAASGSKLTRALLADANGAQRFALKMRPSRGLFAQQLLRLDWMVPHRGLPHGLCGCASLLCGGVIVCESLSGSYAGVQGPLLLCYCLTTAANSVAGYLIAGRAPRVFRVFFQCAAVFQLCLVYYALRFSPLWLRTWPATTSAADMAVAAMLPFNIAAFVFAGFVHLPLLAALAVLFGSFALALLAVYPAQLESDRHLNAHSHRDSHVKRALTPTAGRLTSPLHRPPPGARRRSVVAVCAGCVPTAKCRYGGIHLRASDRDVLGHALRRDPLAATHHRRPHLRRVCTSEHAAPTPTECAALPRDAPGCRDTVMRHATDPRASSCPPTAASSWASCWRHSSGRCAARIGPLAVLRPPACTPPCTGYPCVCWQVLMQEVYMPGVSTQRLYLPCPAPPTGSWQANLADSLDTSALAQSILARLRRVGLDV